GRKQIGFVSYPDGYFRTITNDTSSYSGISLSAMATTLATVQQTTMNEITLIPSPGGRTTDIPFRSKRAIHDVAWAIDGGILLSDATRLVHTDIDGSHEKLFLGDPDGRLTGVQSCVEGRSILFEWSFRAGVNRENVWRSDLDGSNAMQLSNGKLDINPVCSPDGKWVYFIDSPAARIMRVRLNGGSPEEVRGNTITDQVAIAPDGKTLAYMAVQENPQLALVDLTANTENARFVGTNPRASYFVQFEPNSMGVAYTIVHQGVGNVWLQPLQSAKGRQITNFR